MSSFHVVLMIGSDTVVTRDNAGEVFVFPNAEEATAYANRMTAIYGGKYQLRRIKSDVDWRLREQERFESGHYIKLPWHKEDWVNKVPSCANHFAHVSNKTQAWVAYTANAENGERDVKTSVRPATYLARNYSSQLSEAVIRQWTATYKKLYDKESILHFATTADEIEKVYQRGPNSCMKSGNFRTGGIHPVRAYAGPDLAVAYTKRNGKISSRAVCWPNKKIHSRIYGDDHLLYELLQEEGYEENELDGARLTKIKYGKRYICPYIDSNHHRVRVGKKYIRITPKGNRYAGNQDGLCGSGFNCALCREEIDTGKAPNNRPERWDHGLICNPCAETRVARGVGFRCAHSNHIYPIRHAVTMYNGETWHEGYINNYDAFRCSQCLQNFPRNFIGRSAIHFNVCTGCAQAATDLANGQPQLGQ